MFVSAMNSSLNGRFFAVGVSDGTVMVFDSVQKKKIAEIKTNIDSSVYSSMLCVSNYGSKIAAAGHSHCGITLYDTQTGRAVWVNNEIKEIRAVWFSDDEKLVYAASIDDRLYTLYAKDGGTTDEFGTDTDGFDYSYQVIIGAICHYGQKMLSFSRKKIPHPKKANRVVIQKRILYVAIGGGLFCVDTEFDTIWKAENKPEEHYVMISYCKEFNTVICVGIKFGSEGTHYFVDAIGADDGKLIASCETDSTCADGFAFINGSKEIVTGDGNVFSFDGEKLSCQKDVYSFED